MSGFRSIREGLSVPLEIDGAEVQSVQGTSVAAALLEAGYRGFGRHPLSGEPQGPCCLIGVCFGCLVEIDGVPDRQACLVTVSAGMRVRTGLDE